MKLEGAYLAISQRDVEAESEEARLGQIQEDFRKEEEEEEQQEFLDSVEGESQTFRKSLQSMERDRKISRLSCL